MAKKHEQVYCQICRGERVFNDKCIKLPNRRIICETCREQHQIKVFKIGCTWHVMGHYEIAARDMDEAILIATDPTCPMPPDPDYIPGSFEVDTETCEELEDEEV